MKLSLIICCLFSLFAIGCIQSDDCVDGINKLPMYGNMKKCRMQLEDDKNFIAICEKSPGRKAATLHMVKRGWEYFYKNQLDTSMMRFNQAWLLDSLNADVYWGFGDLVGKQRKFKESLRFFKKSLKLKSDNAKTWSDESISYGNIFFETKDQTYLDSAIISLKNAVRLDSSNPMFYEQLTSCYAYFMQKDSARKYLAITDKLDPRAVRPEVRQMLNGK